MLCPHGLPGEGAPAALRAAPPTVTCPPTRAPRAGRPPTDSRLPSPPAVTPSAPTPGPIADTAPAPPHPARETPYTPPLTPSPALTPPSLLDPGVARDPYPLYRTLRRRHPLLYDAPFGAWLVSRYEDVRAVLADPRFGAPEPGPVPARLEGAFKVFQDRVPAALAAGVERAAYVLARRLLARQEADLVAEFCQWLPTAAVVAALGLPIESTARVHALCRAGLDHFGGPRPALTALLGPHIARRRAHPGDDPLSVLCAARADGRPLVSVQRIRFCGAPALSLVPEDR
ncbi:hypothetical protein AB0912_27675, partial [Streptomyces sp. NPDC007084]